MKLLLSLLLALSATASAGDPDFWAFKLAKDAQAKGRRTGHCALHHRDMTAKTVPVVLGFNDVAWENPVPGDTRVRFFPHAAAFSVSDHAGRKGTPKTATVFICPKCQEAEKQWQLAHPK